MKIAVITLFLFIPFIAKPQTPNYNLPPLNYYEIGTITLKDFTKYECRKIHIIGDSLRFVNINSGLNQTMPLINIDYLRVKVGNQGWMWCGYGALLMGLSAILAVAGEEAAVDDPAGIIIGFTLGGAAVGGLIGLAIPKWKTYYLSY